MGKGLIRGLLEQRSDESMAGLITRNSLNSISTNSGVSVTPDNSLQLTAVSACVRVLSETLAMLPLHIFKNISGGNGREKAINHYLYPLLASKPNPEMSSFDFRDTLCGHMAQWGNAFSYIDYDKLTGNIKGLWPLMPDTTTVWREANTRKVWYAIQMHASMGGGYEWHPADEIWHLRIFSKDGLTGRSFIRTHKEALGISMATEAFGAKFFGNGSRPGIVLQYPGKFTDEVALENIRESWINQHEGIENAHRVAILEEGMELKEVGIHPDEAQFLETRRFQAEEIARIFRVPPHMIGILDKATFSNIEQQSIEFVTRTMMPWIVNWEQSIVNNLLTPTEARVYYPKFILDSLLRGDTLSRYQAYGLGRNGGWLSANDIRALEDMNPIDGGDKYLAPLNYTDLLKLGKDGQGGAIREISSMITMDSDPNGQENRSEDRLKVAVERLFEDVMGRILKRESQDLTAMAKKQSNGDQVETITKEVEKFYDQHSQWAKRLIQPIIESCIVLIGIEDIDYRAFLSQFETNYKQKECEKVMNLVASALEKGNDAREILKDEVEFWVEDRSKELALEESNALFTWLMEVQHG